MSENELMDRFVTVGVDAMKTRLDDIPVFDAEIERERAFMLDPANRERLAEWVRARPPVILDLMQRFPPWCRVRATQPLTVPRERTIGVVRSWFEGGQVSVQQERGADYGLLVPVGLRAQCDPEWLEVVGYAGEWTPARIAEIRRKEAT